MDESEETTEIGKIMEERGIKEVKVRKYVSGLILVRRCTTF
jgi:hypothetical protein